MNNWIELSHRNLAANYGVVRMAAGAETEVLAVVKANAYGHGAEGCSKALVGAGARWLGVASAPEGAVVRQAVGADVPVLVMCGLLPKDVGAIREHGLTPVVWTAEQVEWLWDCPGLRVHVEVDTGMGRQGASPGEELGRLLEEIAGTGLEVDGVLTHFCSSEEAGSALTRRQQRLFEASVAQVRAAGLRPGWVHAGNSSTIDNPAQEWPWLVELAATVGARAMVRAGLALYGYCLPIEGLAEAKIKADLKPVLSWKARVLAVRALGVGETVGYGAAFMAGRPMRVATLAVGYADGLRRELSAGGWVMIRGKRARIVGRISMNLTVVDVTDIKWVEAGDEAVILGEGVTAEDHARWAGTIAYEILCGVHPCG